MVFINITRKNPEQRFQQKYRLPPCLETQPCDGESRIREMQKDLYLRPLLTPQVRRKNNIRWGIKVPLK